MDINQECALGGVPKKIQASGSAHSHNYPLFKRQKSCPGGKSARLKLKLPQFLKKMFEVVDISDYFDISYSHFIYFRLYFLF